MALSLANIEEICIHGHVRAISFLEDLLASGNYACCMTNKITSSLTFPRWESHEMSRELLWTGV